MDRKKWLELQNGSDIRGVATEGVEGEKVNLTPLAVEMLAVSFVYWLSDLKSQSPEYLKISVGRDSRISGTTLMSAFIEGILSKVMTYQLGFDFRFDTKYYADYYSPALGMFYVQHVEKIGDYPWVDLFVNLKIKRTRFYVKYSNLGTMMVRGKYYTTPGYAAQIGTASFGLSWTFYD